MDPSILPDSWLLSPPPGAPNDSLVVNDFTEQVPKEEEERDILRVLGVSLDTRTLNEISGETQDQPKLFMKKSEVPLSLATDLLNFASVETRPLTNNIDFIDTLTTLRIPGPLPLCTTPEYIGRGNQFTVYRSDIPYIDKVNIFALIIDCLGKQYFPPFKNLDDFQKNLNL